MYALLEGLEYRTLEPQQDSVFGDRTWSWDAKWGTWQNCKERTSFEIGTQFRIPAARFQGKVRIGTYAHNTYMTYDSWKRAVEKAQNDNPQGGVTMEGTYTPMFEAKGIQFRTYTDPNNKGPWKILVNPSGIQSSVYVDFRATPEVQYRLITRAGKGLTPLIDETYDEPEDLIKALTGCVQNDTVQFEVTREES